MKRVTAPVIEYMAARIGESFWRDQQQGELQKAFEAHSQAAQRMQEFGDPIGLGKMLAGRGIDLAMGGMLVEARESLTTAVEVLLTTPDTETLKSAQGALAEVEALLAQGGT